MSLRVSATWETIRDLPDCVGCLVRIRFDTSLQQARGPRSGRHVSTIRPDRRPTTLVIDDESFIRWVVRRALEPEMAVLEESDGDEGLGRRAR